MTLKSKLETRFPNHDWSHMIEDSCFIQSKGVYWIKESAWYSDLPNWTSAEIKAFIES